MYINIYTTSIYRVKQAIEWVVFGCWEALPPQAVNYLKHSHRTTNAVSCTTTPMHHHSLQSYLCRPRMR